MIQEQMDALLKRFPHTRFFPELRLLTWHPEGTLDDALADEVVGMLESEERFEAEPFHRYVDLSRLTLIHLKIGHMFQIAARRREAMEPVKSAFFSDSAVGFGIARMYESLMRGATIEVRAFRDRDSAAEWLGVPLPIIEV